MRMNIASPRLILEKALKKIEGEIATLSSSEERVGRMGCKID